MCLCARVLCARVNFLGLGLSVMFVLPVCLLAENTIGSIDFKDVVKNNSKELKKILEPQYGLLDQLVSQGTCDLEQVKAIENTESSTLHRKKIVNELVEKLTSNRAQKKQILDILRMNNQHHVAELIEQERKFCLVIILL